METQVNIDSVWLLRELGTGIIAFLLGIITYALMVFIYEHRIVLTVEDKEARDAAVGLAVVFGALALRAFDLWIAIVSGRMAWAGLYYITGTSAVYFTTLLAVLFGVVLTVRAFHPWPVWAVLVGLAVGIPIVVGFL